MGEKWKKWKLRRKVFFCWKGVRRKKFLKKKRKKKKLSHNSSLSIDAFLPSFVSYYQFLLKPPFFPSFYSCYGLLLVFKPHRFFFELFFSLQKILPFYSPLLKNFNITIWAFFLTILAYKIGNNRDNSTSTEPWPVGVQSESEFADRNRNVLWLLFSLGQKCPSCHLLLLHH